MASRPPERPGPTGPSHATWRQRFILMNAMRVGGVLMIVFGIALLQGLIDLPPVVAYILIALGLFETFVTPQILARMWRNADRGGDPMPGPDPDDDRGHGGRR